MNKTVIWSYSTKYDDGEDSGLNLHDVILELASKAFFISIEGRYTIIYAIGDKVPERDESHLLPGFEDYYRTHYPHDYDGRDEVPNFLSGLGLSGLDFGSVYRLVYIDDESFLRPYRFVFEDECGKYYYRGLQDLQPQPIEGSPIVPLTLGMDPIKNAIMLEELAYKGLLGKGIPISVKAHERGPLSFKRVVILGNEVMPEGNIINLDQLVDPFGGLSEQFFLEVKGEVTQEERDWLLNQALQVGYFDELGIAPDDIFGVDLLEYEFQ